MTAILTEESAKTAWICECCFLEFHGYDAHELGEEPDQTPLGLIDASTLITDGMLAKDHECEDRHIGRCAVIGCGEELRDFDYAPCHGCASQLAGSRRAVTFWQVSA